MTVSTLKWFDRFTHTPARRPLRLAAQDAQISLGRALASIFTSVPSLDTTADELFDKAAAYEKTQPSYAADLRAAGRLAQAKHFGNW